MGSLVTPFDIGTPAPGEFMAINWEFTDTAVDVHDPRLSVDANSLRWGYDADGDLQEIPVNTLRAWNYAWHDLDTLECWGALFEPTSTNHARNNTMLGAASPSTIPSAWASSNVGLSRDVSDPYIYKGVECIDVRYYGTTGSTTTALYWEAVGAIAAVNGDVHAQACFVQIVGGDTTNISALELQANQYDGASAFLVAAAAGIQSAAVDGTWRRIKRTTTANKASTASMRPYLRLGHASGVAIDITLRIGNPTTEKRASATSPIKTAGAIASRLIEACAVQGRSFSDYLNATEGTILIDYTIGDDLQNTRVLRFTSGGSGVIDIVSGSGSGAGGYLFAANDSGVAQASVPGSATNVKGNRYRVCGSYKVDSFKASRNGGAISTDFAAELATVNKLVVGSGGTANALNGPVRELKIWNKQLSEAEHVSRSAIV